MTSFAESQHFQSFAGLWVALATPFKRDGELDLAALGGLIRRTCEGGVDGLVSLGTTGEAPTLTDEERDAVIALCVAQSSVPVIVGSGSNSTRQAVSWTKRAEELGAVGALVVTPYYNKPNPDGLVAHYQAIAEASPEMALVAYNVPGRTGLNIDAAVLERLWSIPSMRAIKESSGSIAQMDRFVQGCPADRSVLAGDDAMALPAIALGARGVVSVLGNVFPKETAELLRLSLEGDFGAARVAHRALSPLMEALFVETNPVPLKAALAHLGLAELTVRSPLAVASERTCARVAGALGSLREAA